MSEVLEIHNLKKKFGTLKAVDDISFSVSKGEICGFLGPNGAGKSTTLRSLLTLIYPDEGTLLVKGIDVFKNRRKALTYVGALIERADFYKYLTALDTLKILAHYHSRPLKPINYHKLLELVGLEDRAHSRVKTFSQGMRQRLGIAQAMLHDPEILILDEPTNGLDPQGMVDMRNLVLRLCKEFGKTILLSSHILSEVEMIADSMVIIHKGRVLAQGRVHDLLHSDEGTVWIGWEKEDSAREILQRETSFIPITVHFSEHGAEFRMSDGQIPETLKKLLNLGFRVVEIRRKRSLEQLFIKITSESYA